MTFLRGGGAFLKGPGGRLCFYYLWGYFSSFFSDGGWEGVVGSRVGGTYRMLRGKKIVLCPASAI